MNYFSKANNEDFFIARGEAELCDSLPPASEKNRIWYVSALNSQATLVHLSTDLHRIVSAERGRLVGTRSSCLYRVIGVEDRNKTSSQTFHKKYDPSASDSEIACLFRLLDSVIDSVLDSCVKNERIGKKTNILINSMLKLFVIDSIFYLLSACEDRDASPRLTGMRARHMSNILNEIQENYTDPELSPSRIARSLSITVRYVHALLKQSGKSFSERLQELRLTAAHRMLNSAYFDASRIGDIAYQAGFSDQSHFNRCFKKRFGASPRMIRRQARAKHGRYMHAAPPDAAPGNWPSD
ncbi:AraC family transcriptional regulator [Methylocystis sp. MJC1]|jgi:AraC-like DNA-binding protein|uniref:helix-turn-helix domain-containing protein n=1 Tax=Methylocystis sp. MJC1 TaxID=2654282 RepID=UPI0013ED5C99|nr:AraC family transcriptional regulator [Methylocystis sp. MJC1]KAF2991237.1 Transcriptional activator NphR [Methylocystis sp. MJC1]MBU6526223.1 helix-turn-helix transcriptional regulator [Methylocystis sp. MJC1]UZX12677.1 AraC family transcriptional regulator [Methylocystis sp. MJC1]